VTAVAEFDRCRHTYATGLLATVRRAGTARSSVAVPAGGVFWCSAPTEPQDHSGDCCSRWRSRRPEPSLASANRSASPPPLGRIGYMHENHACPRIVRLRAAACMAVSPAATEEIPETNGSILSCIAWFSIA